MGNRRTVAVLATSMAAVFPAAAKADTVVTAKITCGQTTVTGSYSYSGFSGTLGLHHQCPYLDQCCFLRSG